jgi:hypothetical protein
LEKKKIAEEGKMKHLIGGRSSMICVIFDVRHCREGKEDDEMLLLRNSKP